MKILFNILGVLLGIVTAFLLFLALFCAPGVSACTKMLQPETIQELLDEIDLPDELEKMIAQNSFTEFNGLDTAFVEDLIHSELMKELLEIYIENLLGILEEDDITLLSEKQIAPLLEEHLPEMTGLIGPYLPAEIELTDEQLTEYVSDTLEPLISEIVSMLPTLEDLGLEEGMISVIRYTYDKTILKYTLLAVIILSGLILFLRFPRFKGFMWLTVLYGFFTLLYFCIYKYCFMKEVQKLEELPIPILEFIGFEYQRCSIIVLACTVAFLIVFIVGRKLCPPRRQNEELVSLEEAI